MIIDTTPAIWDPATGRVYTFLKEDGRCYFSGETMEEIRVKGYISTAAVVLPWAEAERKHSEADRARYCTGAQPITAERFDEMLNILPPERWTRGTGSESFRMSERLTGSIASFYLRIGDLFWEINEDQSTTHDQLLKIARAVK